MISIDWGDTRMSATMESVLKGYRVIYPNSEYQNNPAAVAKAAATLVGTSGISGDKGGSRVWWDTGGPNF